MRVISAVILGALVAVRASVTPSQIPTAKPKLSKMNSRLRVRKVNIQSCLQVSDRTLDSIRALDDTTIYSIKKLPQRTINTIKDLRETPITTIQLPPVSQSAPIDDKPSIENSEPTSLSPTKDCTENEMRSVESTVPKDSFPGASRETNEPVKKPRVKKISMATAMVIDALDARTMSSIQKMDPATLACIRNLDDESIRDLKSEKNINDKKSTNQLVVIKESESSKRTSSRRISSNKDFHAEHGRKNEGHWLFSDLKANQKALNLMTAIRQTIRGASLTPKPIIQPIDLPTHLNLPPRAPGEHLEVGIQPGSHVVITKQNEYQWLKGEVVRLPPYHLDSHKREGKYIVKVTDVALKNHRHLEKYSGLEFAMAYSDFEPVKIWMETVTVNPFQSGASVLVLYMMARHCAGVTATGCGHHSSKETTFNWVFWYYIACLFLTMQWLLVRLLDVGLWTAIQNDEILPTDQRPLALFPIAAVIIFLYNSFSVIFRQVVPSAYACYQMNSYGFFQSDAELMARRDFTRTGLPAPVATEFFAILLPGCDLIVGVSIAASGCQLLMSANTLTDLMLDAVALHFLYIVGDFVTQLVPEFGLIWEIEVPKIAVLPRYVNDPQWRDAAMFYWVTKIIQYGFINTPIIALGLAFYFWWGVQHEGYFGAELMVSTWVIEMILLSLLWILSVMPLWTHLFPKDIASIEEQTASMQNGADKMKYAKIACLTLVHFSILFTVPQDLYSLLADRPVEKDEWWRQIPLQLPTLILAVWSVLLVVIVCGLDFVTRFNAVSNARLTIAPSAWSQNSKIKSDKSNANGTSITVQESQSVVERTQEQLPPQKGEQVEPAAGRKTKRSEEAPDNTVSILDSFGIGVLPSSDKKTEERDLRKQLEHVLKTNTAIKTAAQTRAATRPEGTTRNLFQQIEEVRQSKHGFAVEVGCEVKITKFCHFKNLHGDVVQVPSRDIETDGPDGKYIIRITSEKHFGVDVAAKFDDFDLAPSDVPLVTVNAVENGAVLVVLYMIARECEGIDEIVAGCGHNCRSWQWWARTALFSIMLQGLMIRVLENAVDEANSNFHSAEVTTDAVLYRILAMVVFFYDAARVCVAPLMRTLYTYAEMNKQNLFIKHKNPLLVHFFALALVGWSLILSLAVVANGMDLLWRLQDPVDLITNIVGLDFILFIDDYTIQVAPSIGMLQDLDVPESLVLPKYSTDQAWRDAPFFYYFSRFVYYGMICAPLVGVFGAVGTVFRAQQTHSVTLYYQAIIYGVLLLPPTVFTVFNVLNQKRRYARWALYVSSIMCISVLGILFFRKFFYSRGDSIIGGTTYIPVVFIVGICWTMYELVILMFLYKYKQGKWHGMWDHEMSDTLPEEDISTEVVTVPEPGPTSSISSPSLVSTIAALAVAERAARHLNLTLSVKEGCQIEITKRGELFLAKGSILQLPPFDLELGRREGKYLISLVDEDHVGRQIAASREEFNRIGSSVETVTVDGVENGAALLVLYMMVRECTSVTASGGCHRSWEWWAKISIIAQALQAVMIRALEFALVEYLTDYQNPPALYAIPPWQRIAAIIIFAYDSTRSCYGVIMRTHFAYYQMEMLNLFHQHNNPLRMKICASLLVGWELLLSVGVFCSGLAVLSLANESLDLILNVVAFHYIYDVDAYILNLAPTVGILGEIEVPKVVVLPQYMFQEQWKETFVFFKLTRVIKYLTLDTPLYPLFFAYNKLPLVQPLYVATLAIHFLLTTYVTVCHRDLGPNRLTKIGLILFGQFVACFGGEHLIGEIVKTKFFKPFYGKETSTPSVYFHVGVCWSLYIFFYKKDTYGFMLLMLEAVIYIMSRNNVQSLTSPTRKMSSSIFSNGQSSEAKNSMSNDSDRNSNHTNSDQHVPRTTEAERWKRLSNVPQKRKTTITSTAFGR